MYEPYEEKKSSKLKEFFKNLRDKIQGFWQELYFQRFRGNFWGIIIIPIALLLMIGLAYTGYVTYTSRVTEAQSKLLILERQVGTLEDELNKANSELNSCSADLDTNKEKLSQTESNLQNTQSSLETCDMEKNELSDKVSQKEASLGELEDKYDTLLNNYNTIQCNYAKRVCGDLKLDFYYFIDGKLGGCCSDTTTESCVAIIKSENSDIIKEIDC